MDQKDTQRAELVRDQDRLRRMYSNIYEKRSPEMVKEVSSIVAKTPEYKQLHKKNVLAGTSAGAVGALIAGLTTRRPRPAMIAGGATGALGSLVGHRRAKGKLESSSKSAVQSSLVRSMDQEGRKNVAIHSYLAQPGIQKLKVQRPWGVEEYEG